MNKTIIIQLFIFAIFFILILFIAKLFKILSLERRISRYSLKIGEEDEKSLLDSLFFKYHTFLKKMKKNEKLEKYAQKYNKYIDIGSTTNPLYFLFNKLVIASLFEILVILSYALQGKIINIASFLISFIIGYYFYDFYLIISFKRKRKKIKNDMLRAVIIMNNAFKVGKSTLQAVHTASLELPNPIGQEFSKIYQDMSYGLSVDAAFLRFAKRVQLEEAIYISSSLTILNKTGGNIVMVFSSIERTLFDKKKLESDLKNSTAASNLVVKVLMAIPILFVGIIYLISPTYFNPLFESSLGIFTLFVIALMFAIYLYLLSKITKVKV